ncbi:MAG: hypothetical protein IJQ57_12170 [Synergistaceae bacterium]|nr:hypothetical protein [Synergistaceae bacterium]
MIFHRSDYKLQINYKGKVIIPFIEEREKLLEVCDAALKFFEEKAQQGERFKFTIDRIGWERFKEIILNALSV